MLLKGIDVSYAQGKVDWKKVKEHGVQFAMIRAGFGWENKEKQTDVQFYANMKGAKEAGIPVGCYHYSYATTPEEAKKEAAFLLSIIKGHQFEYPIAFDLEDKCQKNLSKQALTDIAVAFCTELEKAGYFPIVYSNLDWVRNRLDMERLSRFDLWYAQYYVRPTYIGTFHIWQYNCNGRVNGINGDVDLNFCYKDYPAIIKKNGLNGYKKPIIDIIKPKLTLDTKSKNMKPGEAYTILAKCTLRPTFEVVGNDVMSVAYVRQDSRGYLFNVYAKRKGYGHITFSTQGENKHCNINIK